MGRFPATLTCPDCGLSREALVNTNHPRVRRCQSCAAKVNRRRVIDRIGPTHYVLPSKEVERYKAGASSCEIARRVGKSVTVVHRELKRLGVSRTVQQSQSLRKTPTVDGLYVFHCPKCGAEKRAKYNNKQYGKVPCRACSNKDLIKYKRVSPGVWELPCPNCGKVRLVNRQPSPASARAKCHECCRLHIPESFVARYLAGEAGRTLARELGCDGFAFMYTLRRMGVQTRTRKEVAKLTAKMLDARDRKALAERHDHHCLMRSVPRNDNVVSIYSEEYRSPEWSAWRRAVFARDDYRCVLCGDRGNRKSNVLNPHHIHRRKTHPHLRYVVDNGVTLCRRCHDRIRHLEEATAEHFERYVEIQNERRQYDQRQLAA